MGKGEIARNEQFLLFPQCFLKACFPGASKGFIVWERVNCLPNDKFLDWSKLKALAEVKVNVTEKMKFVLGRIESLVGKGANAGYQHFLLFQQCFQNAFCLGSLKVRFIVWLEVERINLKTCGKNER